MNSKYPELCKHYSTALRKDLKSPPTESIFNITGTEERWIDARRLGRRAAKLGLTIAELARVHTIALIEGGNDTKSTLSSEVRLERSGAFFASVLLPFDEALRHEREANLHMTQRTKELAIANHLLEGEISQRKAVEESLRTSEKATSDLLTESRILQKELRHLSRQLLDGLEEERKRISRELHDVVAQMLVGININLATLRSKNTANTADLNQRILDAQKLLEDSVHTVNSFARDLRPTVLDDLGLIPALRGYLEGFQERTGIQANIAADPGVERLSASGRTTLFRVAQESLSNVFHHAKASQVEIRLQLQGSLVTMEIKDNGIGFEVGSLTPTDSRIRLGLLGMRERVEMVEGTFAVTSALGKQTTVRVTIPVGSSSPQPKPSRRTKADS